MISSVGSVGSSFTSLGTVSRPETTAAQMLKDMDVDGDGQVSKDEFVQFGETMKAQEPKGPPPPPDAAGAGAPPRPPSPDGLFASADGDSSGSLSLDELSNMLAEAENRGKATEAGLDQSAADMAAQLFKDMDADQDGKISKDEFVQFGEKMRAEHATDSEEQTRGIAPPSPEDLFASTDADGDGLLTVDELSTFLTNTRGV